MIVTLILKGVIRTSKQLVCQKFIFKIHTERLRKNGWRLTIPLDEARRNDEIIALADSQILRWIDDINGIKDADEKAKDIKRDIRLLRKGNNDIGTRREIKRLYAELDKLQFKQDYMCLVIDSKKDYYRACKGFTINGIEYVRLLGTNGGIKNSTIVFISKAVSEEIKRRVENDRDQTKELVTAKLEAYKALTCSASMPVSMPNGVLIINDAETEFISNVISLNDDGCDEPIIEEEKDKVIKNNASDGFGIMLPSLAERWSRELQLEYVTSGVNTRFSFEKGMVFTFDFLDFANNVAERYEVVDAWGDVVDIRNVELILTTSMVKLWDSYSSCEDYINKSVKNGYTFGISKTCPERLENERCLNYQFIQSYDLSDEDIDKLIEPTMTEIDEVLGGDWRKTVLFLKGSGLNERNIHKLNDDYIKAIMINPDVLKDPFVQNNIYQLIKNRINEAKVGVLKVHANYSIVSGDPYLLCQSMFGMELTGILKAGEIYNGYWSSRDSENLACFRAPMTCHNNIRLVTPVKSDEAKYWFRYMNTCTILNAWDTTTAALNGCDFDGDLVMLTDNSVLVDNLKELPTLMCSQRRATKKISNENDFIRSNIDSFGNEIGQTTNWITSMFEVRSKFPEDSDEYRTLSYRIQCGQLYQQNAIDKAKGIVCKPMPKLWYDRRTVNKTEDDSIQRDLNRRIVADKKPYFMRYIYPSLMKQYNTYIKNTNRNALREFQMTIEELYKVPVEDATDRQKDFIKYYEYRMPVGISDCVMNKICRRFEEKFDGCISRRNSGTSFDYSILKGDEEYTPRQFSAIKKLYDDYNKRLISYSIFADYERVDECDSFLTLSTMNDDFRKECVKICPSRESLCNLIIDMCYSKSATKRFAWSMCGTEIINNLLNKNGRIVSYPELDEFGDIEYCGCRYSLKQIVEEEFNDYCTE